MKTVPSDIIVKLRVHAYLNRDNVHISSLNNASINVATDDTWKNAIKTHLAVDLDPEIFSIRRTGPSEKAYSVTAKVASLVADYKHNVKQCVVWIIQKEKDQRKITEFIKSHISPILSMKRETLRRVLFPKSETFRSGERLSPIKEASPEFSQDEMLTENTYQENDTNFGATSNNGQNRERDICRIQNTNNSDSDPYGVLKVLKAQRERNRLRRRKSSDKFLFIWLTAIVMLTLTLIDPWSGIFKYFDQLHSHSDHLNLTQINHGLYNLSS